MSNPAGFPAQLIGNLWQSETMEIAKIKQMVESHYRYMQTQGYENIYSPVNCILQILCRLLRNAWILDETNVMKIQTVRDTRTGYSSGEENLKPGKAPEL